MLVTIRASQEGARQEHMSKPSRARGPDAALSVVAPSQMTGQLPTGSPRLSPAYLRPGEWQHSPPALQGSDAHVGAGWQAKPDAL